jgi:ADP-heptose:LPS heptosyltransferase
MGDVAMTVPVIRHLLHDYPDLKLTFVSDKKFAPLFSEINRCHFVSADLKGKHSGIFGLFRLFKQIGQTGKITAIADLHQVLRSNVLKFFFKLTGVKIISIDKGRIEKKKLTSQKNKSLHQLPSGFERYAEVFRQLGYPVSLNPSVLNPSKLPLPVNTKILFENTINIGIAPFAKHAEKMYPLQKMKSVVEEMSKMNISIFLFGGGNTEQMILEEWQNEFKGNVFNVAGKYNLKEELALISNLKLMCSMDSANMHLASLFNVPVVSVWGPTHPFAGFYGWGQHENNIIDVQLNCRPCSVYGNKKCFRGDHACMEQIHPETIIKKIQWNLSK